MSDREDIRKKRNSYYANQSTNIEPLFYQYRNGPKIVKAPDAVMKSRNALIKKCVANYVAHDKKGVCEKASLSDVIDSLKEDVNQSGLGVHLLPYFPFDMLADIQVDQKYSCRSNGEIVSYIINQVLDDDNVAWVNTPTAKQLTQVIEAETPLDDPMLSKSTQDVWRLLSLQHYDRPFHVVDVAAQYIISKSALQAKCKAMLKCFTSFTPYYIPIGKDSPVEIALIQRYQKMCKLYSYGYQIEKMVHCRSGCVGFIRVPDTFRDTVDSILQQSPSHKGWRSFQRVVKDIMALGTVGSPEDFKTYAKVVHLLRQVSNGVENLDISDDHRWIFSYNQDKQDNSNTLQGDCLVFDEDNLRKGYFTRSLSQLEKNNNMDLLDFQRYQSSHSRIMIGFPLGCDLRSVTDAMQMCPMRFKSITYKLSHMMQYHGISQTDQKMIDFIREKAKIDNKYLEDVYRKGEKEWLEEKGIHNFESILKVENHHELLPQFLEHHTQIVGNIADWEKLLSDYENTLQCVKAEHDEIQTKSTDIKERDIARNTLCQMEGVIPFYRRMIDYHKSLLLPVDQLEDLLVTWNNALCTVTRGLEIYNDIQEKELERRIALKQMTDTMLSGFNKARQRAGKNLACVSPASYIQSVKDHKGTKDGDTQMATIALSVAQARAEKMTIHGNMQPYLDYIQDLEGGGTRQTTGQKISENDDNRRNGGDREVEEICRRETAMPLGNNNTLEKLPHERGALNQRKRKPDWQPPPEDSPTIIKTMRAAESDDSVHTLKDFKELVQWHNSGNIKIDTKRMSIHDILTMKKSMPGSRAIQIGKGHSSDVTTYEPVDPLTIKVDIKDYKDIIFSIYILMRSRGNRLIIYQSEVLSAMMTALNILFQLSSKGNTKMKDYIGKAIGRSLTSSSHTLTPHGKEKMWLVFMNAIKLLNMNREQRGIFNDFFCVRFAKHGDASMVPVKTGPECMYTYESEPCEISIDRVIDFLSSYNIESIDNKIIEENTLDFHKRQASLFERVKSQFRSDADPCNSQPRQLLAIAGNNAKKGKRHIAKAIHMKSSANGTIPNWKYRVDSSIFFSQHQALESQNRCTDMNPSHVMSDEDLVEHDNEINRIRKEVCVICLDPFSNRPLEGFSCAYRKIERDFLRSKQLDDNVNIESSKGLQDEFLQYASQHIKQVENRGFIEANGMHLFHRACIRRSIQSDALDHTKQCIKCPVCQEVVYNKAEKDVIVGNIERIASSIGEWATSDKIANYTTDDLINLKSDLERSDKDPICRYFTPTSITDEKCVEEDGCFVKETEGHMQGDVSKVKSSIYMDEYKQFAVMDQAQFNKQFTPDGLVEFVKQEKCFHKPLAVQYQAISV